MASSSSSTRNTDRIPPQPQHSSATVVALDPQHVAATMDHIILSSLERRDESGESGMDDRSCSTTNSTNSSTTTSRRNTPPRGGEVGNDHPPQPPQFHESDNDADLLTAALESLDLVPHQHRGDDDDASSIPAAAATAEWMRNDPLPELELFSGSPENDPFWPAPSSSLDDHDDLWNVFDDDDDDEIFQTATEPTEATPAQPTATIQQQYPPSSPDNNNNNNDNDALQILEQLEHLTLWDNNHNDIAENDNNNSTDPWRQEQYHHLDAPPPSETTTFDEETGDLEPLPFFSSTTTTTTTTIRNTMLSAQPQQQPQTQQQSPPQLPLPDDESWWSYCHFCDASRAVLPTLNDEQAWALATAWAAAQPHDDPGPANNNDEAWHRALEYYSLLQNHQQLSDPWSEQLLDFGNDQEQQPDDDSSSDDESDDDDNRSDDRLSGYHTSEPSPAARAAAEPLRKAFRPKNASRTCLGHQERILGCEFSPCGQFLATASQDSTVRIWNTGTNKLVSTLRAHSRNHECLRVTWASPAWTRPRHHPGNDGTTTKNTNDDECHYYYPYLLATGGADGVVHLWECDDPFQDAWMICATLDHSTYRHVTSNKNNNDRGTASDGTAAAALESIQEEEEEQATNKLGTEETDGEDKPQIYAMQFIDNWKALPNHVEPPEKSDPPTTDNINSFLLTSSDDHVHLWEVDRDPKNIQTDNSHKLHLREVMSLYFGPLQNAGYGVRITSVTDQSIWNVLYNPSKLDDQQQQHDTLCPNNNNNNNNNSINRFGGDRNPHNLIFVFDASYCAVNGLLGVALSDGSVRLVNGRCVCLAVLQLPGNLPAHLTSLDWDATGTRLATTVATGHLIIWGIETTTTTTATTLEHSPADGVVRTSCRAVLEGGHTVGRPLYGARFLLHGSGSDDVMLLLSWGSDGRLCVWDGRAQGEIHAPLAVLRDDEAYPLFAVSVTNPRPMTEDEREAHGEKGSVDASTCDPNSKLMRMMMTIAIAGGGSEESFLGIPVYMQDIWNMRGGILVDDELAEKDAKRLKCEQ